MKKIKGLFVISFLIIMQSCDTSEEFNLAINGGDNTENEEDIDTDSSVKETWVFIMAGQSNMAGLARIAAPDTITNSRIFSINEFDELIIAKEPIHFYDPTLSALDCGLSFGHTIIANTPENIDVLLIPTAIGGSNISQWINDETTRDVKLLTNFSEKVDVAKQLGEIKGILWHQGESDASRNGVLNYHDNLVTLFASFRDIIGDQSLPVLIGELGSFSGNIYWPQINAVINDFSNGDINSSVISTSDLDHRGDSLHFNSSGQRTMGERFALKYLENL